MEVSGHLHTMATLPPGRAPCTHWIGGWVGPRAGLDSVLGETVLHRKLPSFLPTLL